MRATASGQGLEVSDVRGGFLVLREGAMATAMIGLA